MLIDVTDADDVEKRYELGMCCRIEDLNVEELVLYSKSLMRDRAECYELIDDLLSVIGKAYKAKSKNAMRNILKDYV